MTPNFGTKRGHIDTYTYIPAILAAFEGHLAHFFFFWWRAPSQSFVIEVKTENANAMPKFESYYA